MPYLKKPFINKVKNTDKYAHLREKRKRIDTPYWKLRACIMKRVYDTAEEAKAYATKHNLNQTPKKCKVCSKYHLITVKEKQ